MQRVHDSVVLNCTCFELQARPAKLRLCVHEGFVMSVVEISHRTCPPMTWERQPTGRLTLRPGCPAWRGKLSEPVQRPRHMLLVTLHIYMRLLFAAAMLCECTLVQQELAA